MYLSKTILILYFNVQQLPEIKIITLYQPWALLIRLNLKRYETRPTRIHHRGLLAIHAGLQPVDQEGFLLIRKALEAAGRDWDAEKNQIVTDLQFGCIATIVNLTDCLQMKSSPDLADIYLEQGKANIKLGSDIVIETVAASERMVGNWESGRFAWELQDNKPLKEQIPIRGTQGIRTLKDPDALEAIAREIRF